MWSWIVIALIALVIFIALYFLLSKDTTRDWQSKEWKEVELQESAPCPDGAHFDSIIIGGGISGISAAIAMKRDCPKKNFLIIEQRSGLGGTWDLFKYPGIRSDSDMYTLGFTDEPWNEGNPIAGADQIRHYLKTVVKKRNIDDHITYNKKLKNANFDTTTKQYTLTIFNKEEQKNIFLSCSFLQVCCGYYDYENPYTPEFEGKESFKGEVIHPQKWKKNFDYKNKKIVVIGSGATAITLIPNLTENASHVTMLQRSPSYILGLPQYSRSATFMQNILPNFVSFAIIRWKNILMAWLLFFVCRSFPNFAKGIILKETKKRLPKDFDFEKHFIPRYKPWDQRLCLSPDGDFFDAVCSSKVSIKTDHIKCFVPTGILLESGELLEADVIVTATGLNLKIFGGATLTIDGEHVDATKKFLYRGMMLDNIPNLVMFLGYTNASWTLKCEITARWVTSMINALEKTGKKTCVAHLPADHSLKPSAIFDFSSGYLTRAQAILPVVSDEQPWNRHQFLSDLWQFKRSGDLSDGIIQLE